MKKYFTLFSLLLATSFTFVSCSNDEVVEAPLPNPNEGIVINGVRWATRNVATFGTFVANPEDLGMFYQWSRPQAWPATGAVTGWIIAEPPHQSNEEQGIQAVVAWEREYDPCPAGWRLPTEAELRSLADADNGWTTVNGVSGRLFGTTPYQIFLPAVGLRQNSSTANLTPGELQAQGRNGNYISRERVRNNVGDITANVWSLNFSSYAALVHLAPTTPGFSVRCVAEYEAAISN